MTTSPRRIAVLEYVCAHRGCSAQEAQRDLGIAIDRVYWHLRALYSCGLLGRQKGIAGVVPDRWWAEQKALDAFEHGSGQAETSGNIGPGLAQNGVVAVPALLPGDAR